MKFTKAIRLLVLRNMRTEKFLTVLAVVGVALGVGLFVGVKAASDRAVSSFESDIKGIAPGTNLEVVDTSGIDFDEQATRRVRVRYGIDTHTGDLIDARLPTASFDAITMSHSIEHLTDPAATLRECLRLLRPGGHLVVVTPNVESRAAKLFGPCWRGWEPPRHLFLFSTGTLRQFLLDAGFVVDEARSCAAASAIVYRVSRILQENGSASTWFRLKLIPWAYAREMEDFKAQRKGRQVAQNVLAIATKPAH